MRFQAIFSQLRRTLLVAVFATSTAPGCATRYPREPPLPPADNDGDGYDANDWGGDDCDDYNPATYPGAPENCSDGKDNDCDGWGDSVDPDCGGDPCPLPTKVYAMRKLFFGETNWDGSLDLDNGWRQYGQPLDYMNTIDDATRSCNPIAGGDVVTDGDEGIDNSFGQNILPILRDYSPNQPDMLTSAGNEMITTGAATYLFEIAKVDVTSCGEVTTAFYRGVNMPTPPTFKSSDTWPLDPASLKDPTDPSAGAVLTGHSSLYGISPTQGGYSSEPDGIWPIMLDVNGSTLVLPIRNAVITMDISMPGDDVFNGQIGGIIDTNELVESITKFAATADPSLCDPQGSPYELLRLRIRAASDIYIGPGAPGTPDCNAVAIGIGFRMNRAQLGEVASPLPPPTDVCLP